MLNIKPDSAYILGIILKNGGLLYEKRRQNINSHFNGSFCNNTLTAILTAASVITGLLSIPALAGEDDDYGPNNEPVVTVEQGKLEGFMHSRSWAFPMHRQKDLRSLRNRTPGRASEKPARMAKPA